MGVKEGQGGVVQDVVVCPAHAVLGGAQEEVPVMAATLPPLREVRGGLAQLQALRQLRVREDLLADTTEELDAVQGAGGALLRDGVDDQGRVWKF